MKKILIPFFLIITLSSCIFNKNTEKIENNSWTTLSWNISENISQTGSENSEKQEENNISKEYKVITEKAYFYTNSTDTEPRKAYVMKWDKIIVDNEKSTENMIFATYTNSSWKTTDWFIKRIKVQEVNFKNKAVNIFESSGNEKCKKIYQFAVWEEYKVYWYRTFEFIFPWKCNGKTNVKMDGMFDWEFILGNNQKWSIINYWMKISTWFPGWCSVEKTTFSKKISKNGFEINILAWKEYCTHEESFTWNNRIDVSISEEWDEWFGLLISFIEIPEKLLKSSYEDLVLIFQNGFTETGKKILQKDIEKIRIQKQKEEELRWEQEEKQIENEKLKKISETKWTKELLEKAEFWDDGDFIRLYYDNKKFFVINTWLTESWWAINTCNWEGRALSECIIDKVSNGFIYWRSSFNYSRDDGWDYEWWYYYTYFWETTYKTNIKTNTTEKIKEWDKNKCFNNQWDIACN